MRYYVTSSGRTWWTIAPEVPGVASEDVPTRDEAIARCRALVAEEVDAYRRLGQPLDVEPSEEIVGVENRESSRSFRQRSQDLLVG